jgi:myo-inositol-1(or 4)-monophosphatase
MSDAELAIAATQAGAAVARAKYGTSLVRLEKSATDFATDADLEVEAVIVDVLRSARPDDAFVGEELEHDGPAVASRTWLVDPLCGTLNYAAQTPLVAVNVCLRSGGRVLVAASADPMAGEVFWTAGANAYLRRADADADADADEILVPSARSLLVDVNLDSPNPGSDQLLAARMITASAFTAAFRPRVLSTTLALAWVAAGRHAAYVTDGDLRDSVHFSSGIALCQAAGCVVTGLFGQPLHTGIGGLIAAADAESHAALVAVITQQASG